MASRYVKWLLINQGKICKLAAGKAIWLERQMSSFQTYKNFSLCFTNAPHA